MADTIQNAPPTTAIPQAPGAPTEQTIPGTGINVPVGGGVEKLITVPAPFLTNSPPWYSPPGTVWSQMGCAVPQPGTQIQCNNRVIWDFNNAAGRRLFNVLWKFSPDRLSDNDPTYDCLWLMYQLLIDGRNRLVAKTTPDAKSALQPTKSTPAPRMFLCYPVPFYGPLGCVNQYIGEYAELIMRMQEEAMQHEDIAKSYFITKDFFDATYPAIKFLLVDMATKFFGVDPKTASDDAYVIPDATWATFARNPANKDGSTSPAPPLNCVGPTDRDLQNIRGLTYEDVIPFLQPWPDSVYKMTSGGVWANSSSPASDGTTKSGAAAVGNSGTPNLAATADPSIFVSAGPPSA